MRPVLFALALLSASAADARHEAAPLGPGEFLWTEDEIPAGRARIVVDLSEEQLVLYRGGVEIGRSSILFGADEKPTPTGRFTVLEKRADHVSNIYGSPMPHMLRLTWGGIAIHGSNLRRFAATHGCVGVPRRFAALMFDHVRPGDRVEIRG